ncbi:MAG: hypothetical protein ACRCSQ_05055, partial [Bacteroidales bacterium]
MKKQMKNSVYFFFLGLTLLMSGCGSTNTKQSVHSDAPKLDTYLLRHNFSLDEAKIFFQKTTGTEAQATMPNSAGFSPGNFSIKWDQARISENLHLLCYNLPIDATNRYAAIVNEPEKRAYKVPVDQRLLIFKGKNENNNFVYLQTLIPTKDLYKQSGDNFASTYLHPGYFKEFSGILIVNQLSSGQIVDVS